MMMPAAALPKDTSLSGSSAPTAFGPPSASAYKRLWVHEALRVFYDRWVASAVFTWSMSASSSTLWIMLISPQPIDALAELIAFRLNGVTIFWCSLCRERVKAVVLVATQLLVCQAGGQHR